MVGFGTNLLLALVIVLVVAILFALVYRNYGSWNNFFIFYFIVFFIAMLASLWARPYGTAVFGVFIVPWFLLGLVFAYLMLKVKPPKYRSKKQREELHYNDAFASGFGLLTWFLIYMISMAVLVSFFV